MMKSFGTGNRSGTVKPTANTIPPNFALLKCVIMLHVQLNNVHKVCCTCSKLLPGTLVLMLKMSRLK